MLASFTGLAERTLVRNGLLAAALGAVGFLLVYQASDYSVSYVGKLAAYICVAVGLTILIGVNGQISLGHAALMAVGAYTMAKFLAPRADQLGRSSTIDVVLGLLAAVVVTAVVGLVIGLAAARLQGPYLAGATLALGVSVLGFVTYFHDTFNGEQGLPIAAPEVPMALSDAYWIVDRYVALIAVAGAVVVLFLGANLMRSGVGRHLAAVRDDPIAAQLCGLSLPRQRVLAFAISSATAGLGGALLGLLLQGANPGSFGLVLSLTVLGAVVIGGLGSLLGAVWGSAVVVYLSKTFEGLEANENLPAAAYGLLLIVVVLVFPGGIQGLFAQLRGVLARLLTHHSASTGDTP